VNAFIEILGIVGRLDFARHVQKTFVAETGRMTEAGSWAVEGIGEDFVPPNADLLLVARAYSIADPDSFDASRELLRQEGILAGSSSGTLLAAALRYCKAQDQPKRVVSFVCDSGAKYLSKVFNPTFIARRLGPHRELHGTVRDVAIPHSRNTSMPPLASCGHQQRGIPSTVLCSARFQKREIQSNARARLA
jgi:threonine synthase